MIIKSFNWRILAACTLLMMVTAGCFQNIGDAEAENVVSQFNTDTPTPLPTDTPPPPTDIPTETPEVIDQPVSDVGGSIESGTSVAQAGDTVDQQEQQVDTWALTATQIVAEITMTADAAVTQTAAALGIGATPTPTETPTFALPAGVTPTMGVVAPPGTVCIHEVKAGENLFRLSLRYGVSVNQLAAASGITNINLIFVGDKITIPGCGTTGVLPPPTSTPVLTATLAGTTGTVQQSAQTGDVTVQTATTGQRIHIVQQYETLFQISLQYGVPIASIANANGITDINTIIMGQELIIPAQ